MSEKHCFINPVSNRPITLGGKLHRMLLSHASSGKPIKVKGKASHILSKTEIEMIPKTYNKKPKQLKNKKSKPSKNYEEIIENRKKDKLKTQNDNFDKNVKVQELKSLMLNEKVRRQHNLEKAQKVKQQIIEKVENLPPSYDQVLKEKKIEKIKLTKGKKKTRKRRPMTDAQKKALVARLRKGKELKLLITG